MTDIRIGIDIGGTFTDLAMMGAGRAGFTLHKELTTPDDPARAVLDGLTTLLANEKQPMAEVTQIVHGTTLVTNAVIERKGAVTGMLVTRGFSDTLDIGLEHRYDLYDLRIGFAEPLVERRARAELDERIRYDGRIETRLDPQTAVTAVRRLIADAGIEALAICFLHSYKNPAHELAARDAVKAAFPGLPVSLSSEVFPYMREYERWTTTTVNAYAQPKLDRYLSRLEDGLATIGFAGRFDLMSSSGGIVTPDLARRYPVRMLESGPAAGVLMAAHHADLAGAQTVLAFDLGGTTAKGAFVQDGAPLKSYEFEAARSYHHRRGSGLPLRTPVVEMTEIGSGGGSLAHIDSRGLLAMGPRSAGADPGPACYGRGGTGATLTDANLLLGILDAGFFLGGAMALDKEKAAAAVTACVGRPLDFPLSRAAFGMHDVINEDIARAFRIHAAERGIDFRHATMVASGGGGPIHGTGVARKLGIPKVILPLGAGAMSALGLLVAPLSLEVARAHPTMLADLDAAGFARIMTDMMDEVRSELGQAGVPSAAVRLVGALDMRFQGQGYEIECPLPDLTDLDAVFAGLRERFLAAYRVIFGNVVLDEPIELISWKVAGTGPKPALGLKHAAPPRGAALKGHRPCWVPEVGDYVATPVYDRYALQPDSVLEGPALVEERESTAFLRSGDRATLDGVGNLVVAIDTAMGARRDTSVAAGGRS